MPQTFGAKWQPNTQFRNDEDLNSGESTATAQLRQVLLV
jgi:hypothetical protein